MCGSKLIMLFNIFRQPPALAVHQFLETFALPILYSLIGEIEDVFHCSEVLNAFSVFDIKRVPDSVADLLTNNFGEVSINQLHMISRCFFLSYYYFYKLEGFP